VANAPTPAGPAGHRRGWGQRGRGSLLTGGLAGILAVTVATIGLGMAAALIAFVVSRLF
jgi:hypothetical protein